MVILGIADSITSGACLVVDGRIVAAVNEERLNREKMSMGFPMRSIVEVMRLGGVSAQDIDSVAVATRNLFWRPEAEPFSDYFREKKNDFRDVFLKAGSAFSTLLGDNALARNAYYRLKSGLTGKRRNEIPKLCVEALGIQAPVLFHDHHLCHAASAYFTSGMSEATVITQDGAGDGKCSRVYRVRDGQFAALHDLDSYDSVGNYYAYITHLCGFKAHRHEGKIAGLAAHGKPTYLKNLQRYVEHDRGEIRNRGRCFDQSAIVKLKAELGDFSREDLSASMQILLEQSVTSYCDHWVKETGIGNLAVAGGVFANVKLNQRLHELESVDELFVHPAMGDDGLAVGAALFAHSARAGFRETPTIGNVYLGTDIEPGDAERAIANAGLAEVKGDGTAESRAAQLLARGKVIARAEGRMEYGPRALGNRSILYQPIDASVNDWLNDRLKRTEFMPFAPVTLYERRHECFANTASAENAARFMTVTFDCTPYMSDKAPAVCHVDGTARPQLLREQDNPGYYALLKEYERLTGLPCLVNTSFNMHEEPIVCSAQEAVEAFLQSELDALLLDERLVARTDDITTLLV